MSGTFSAGCGECCWAKACCSANQRRVDVTHKRWRPRSRMQPCGNPFRLPMGHVIGGASLKITWAGMRTPTLCSQTCRRLQRALCRILHAQTPRWIRQRLQESGRHRAHGRPGSRSRRPQLAHKHRPCEGKWAQSNGVTRVRIRQGCEFLFYGRICAGCGTKVLGTRSLRTRAVVRQRRCDERTQIHELAPILTLDPTSEIEADCLLPSAPFLCPTDVLSPATHATQESAIDITTAALDAGVPSSDFQQARQASRVPGPCSRASVP